MGDIKAKLLDAEGKIKGELELSADIFGVVPREGILNEIVRWQRARWRSGTASTKTRAEVRGGGRKPWRQKHTGRARHGSIRAPQWVGGGVVHGPKPRCYQFKLNKKVRKLGLKMALSSRALTEKVFIAEAFPSLDRPKTKLLKKYLENVGTNSALIILPQRHLNLEKSADNLPQVKVLAVEGLNVYDILNHETVIFDKEALSKIEERLRG
ncbi:MAG: 50S ribosomal protein L4 [Caldimicrobium sp.]|nr:50S ribosomal protein L4 [Caldimicrobium sp.]MCX7613865.1 50S ribosomal protein L4 [Caldimicrobium sp.]MDW8182770.1 50S ribosomal protein L4 [Caldimicrobium sp.]